MEVEAGSLLQMIQKVIECIRGGSLMVKLICIITERESILLRHEGFCRETR